MKTTRRNGSGLAHTSTDVVVVVVVRNSGQRVYHRRHNHRMLTWIIYEYNIAIKERVVLISFRFFSPVFLFSTDCLADIRVQYYICANLDMVKQLYTLLSHFDDICLMAWNSIPSKLNRLPNCLSKNKYMFKKNGDQILWVKLVKLMLFMKIMVAL